MNKKKLLQIPFCILALLLANNASGQQLHHQMLSSMGSTNVLKSGMVVLQTVGQQSVIGNATVAKMSVQQGFQHSLISRSLPIYLVNTATTTIYPNPFNGAININFSQSVAGEMTISLYNMFGILLYKEERLNPETTIGVNFGKLPAASYVLTLKAKNYSYNKTLIKL